MDSNSLLGHVVTASSARGVIRRTVVADLGRVVVLAHTGSVNQLTDNALAEFSIGFPRDDVIEDFGIDTSVLLKHNVQYEQAEHGQAGPDRQGVG
jgi:hypothetical protein